MKDWMKKFSQVQRPLAYSHGSMLVAPEVSFRKLRGSFGETLQLTH